MDEDIDLRSRNSFHQSKFQLSDGTIAHAGLIVTLKTGTAHIKLKAVYNCPDRGIPVADGAYVKSKIDVFQRPLKHFQPVNPVGSQFDEIDADDLAEDQMETIMTTQLYQTNEETARFGTFLTKDSQGRIVLEMKGSAGVEAFDPKTVEEVMPYTVAMTQTTDHNSSRVHVEMPKGQVSKGDILLSAQDGNLYTVVQTDTKSKRAMDVTKFKFRKLVTTALGDEDDGDDAVTE